ncbi:MarR family winged helix-turn-helix transcriptional regulator [Agromyces bauzanensis]
MRPTMDDLGEVIGYVLKRAQSALRARIDEALRPLGVTTPQYACLELLQRTPGISGSELARGAFVTRQTMNSVLRGLQDRGLVTRADQAPSGRARPVTLTESGVQLLAEASDRVAAIDDLMIAGLTDAERLDLLDYLGRCITALEGRTDPSVPA